MSFKTSLLKTAIKCTPDKMIVWAANFILKGIAELSDFSFDIDTRKINVTATLYGETEPIEVWVNGFAITNDGGSYKFILQQAQSNRAWLNNIFARLVGKEWKIPAMPKYAAQMALIAELLKAENLESEVVNVENPEQEKVDVVVANDAVGVDIAEPQALSKA